MEGKGNEEVEVESNDDDDVLEEEYFFNEDNNEDYVPEIDEELNVSGDENVDNEARPRKERRIHKGEVRTKQLREE